MAKYLLIESRDPFEFADADYFYGLARDLAQRGNDLTFFLIQNGVLVARKGAQAGQLAGLQQAGAKVLADEFSLRERGIKRDALAPAVTVSEIGALVDMLTEDGRKVVWH